MEKYNYTGKAKGDGNCKANKAMELCKKMKGMIVKGVTKYGKKF